MSMKEDLLFLGWPHSLTCHHVCEGRPVISMMASQTQRVTMPGLGQKNGPFTSSRPSYFNFVNIILTAMFSHYLCRPFFSLCEDKSTGQDFQQRQGCHCYPPETAHYLVVLSYSTSLTKNKHAASEVSTICSSPIRV